MTPPRLPVCDIEPWGRTPTSSLTDDHEDEDDGGRSGADVEHESDVVRQLVDVVHVGHEDGWEQEADGDAHLRARGSFTTQTQLIEPFIPLTS